MATIVGDKLKLTNYSYVLNESGTDWNTSRFIESNRDKEDKLIDAIDIDWRPYTIKKYSSPTDVNPINLFEPGKLMNTEQILEYISYAYSFAGYITVDGAAYHNQIGNRPTFLSNIFWDQDNQKLSYKYWASVGAVYGISNDDFTRYDDYVNGLLHTGEVFNNYVDNIASANYSHAEGNRTTASGNGSHAEGIATTASNNYSHAEGRITTASGNSSHSEGNKTIASGGCSHAEGSLTIASGDLSHSQGFFTTASGNYSFAGGMASKAEGNESTALGRFAYALYDDQIALGTYNLSKNGYLFNLGNGSSDDNRHNAIAVTNNGWTYLSGLYSYINNFVSQQTDITFSYDSANFVRISSFDNIERLDTNTYQLNLKSYAIPTKNYIDKLLEAKDVLHLSGGVKLNATTSNASGNITNVEWYHKNTIGNYSPEEISYLTYDSYSAGSLWKVTNSGYFGNIYCQPGDVLMSYDDSATSTNTAGWLLVGSHIGVIENHGQLDKSYPDATHQNQVLSNVNLSEDGKLSYTFTPIVTSYSSNQNNVFLTNIALVGDNDKIRIAYTYTGFTTSGSKTEDASIDTLSGLQTIEVVKGVEMKENGNLAYTYQTISFSTTPNHHSYEGIEKTAYNINTNAFKTIANDKIGLIGNVHLSELGKLSYEYFEVNHIRNHHTGSVTITPVENPGFDNSFPIITGVSLSNDGTLSGTSTNINMPSKNHHSNTDATLPGATSIDISCIASNGTINAYQFAYINNVHLSDSGELTYSYGILSIKDSHQHHSGGKDTGSTGKTLKFGESFKYLKSVSLSNAGELSGTDTAYTLPSLSIDTTTTNGGTTTCDNIDDKNITITYVSDIDVNNEGKITLTKSSYTFKDIHSHHNTDGVNTLTTTNKVTYSSTNPTNTVDGIQFTYVSGVKINSIGYLSYSYNTYSINGLRNHHYSNGESITNANKDVKTTNTLKFSYIANIRLESNGTLAYEYSTYILDNIRDHHSTTNSTIPTSTEIDLTTSNNVITYIKGVNLSDSGELTYSYGSISLKQIKSMGGGNEGSESTNQSVDVSSSNDTVNISYIANVNLDDDGKLTYTYNTYSISNIKNHHTTNNDGGTATSIVSSSNNSIKLIRGVNLSSSGELSYSYVTVSNLANHHSNGTKVPNTVNLDLVTNNLDGIKFAYIGGVSLSNSGQLTYNYTAYTLTGLRNHHSTNDSAIPTSLDVDLTTSDKVLTYISYVNLDTDGTLTYAYGSINLKNIHAMGGGNEGTLIENALIDVKTTNILKIAYVADVNLDDDGKLTYTYSTYTLSNIRDHHSTNTAVSTTKSVSIGGNVDGIKFAYIGGVSLSNDGKLSYHYNAYTVTGLSKHHSTDNTIATPTTSHEVDLSDASYILTYITGVNLSETGKLTYSYGSIKLKNIHALGGGNEPLDGSSQSVNIANSNDTVNITYLSNVNIGDDGKLSYNVSSYTISNLRNHHSYSPSEITDDASVVNNIISTAANSTNVLKFAYIANVNLSDDGVLSYEYSTYTLNNLRDHHVLWTRGNKSNTTSVDINDTDETDAVKFTYIGGINFENNGRLSYNYNSYTITGLRKHHSTNNTPVSNNSESVIDVNACKFISAVNLSDNGTLSYAYFTICDLVDHHGYIAGTIPTTTTVDLSTTGSDTTVTEYKFAYINNVSLSDDGTLSYSYGCITLKDSHNHHGYTRGSVPTTTTVDLSNGQCKFAYINNVSLSNSGKLTYSYGCITIKDSHNHHQGTLNSQPMETKDILFNNEDEDRQIVSVVSGQLSLNGKLEGQTIIYNLPTVSNIGTKGNEPTYNVSDTDNGNNDIVISYLSNIKLNAALQLTYSYNTVTISNIKNHHTTNNTPVSNNSESVIDVNACKFISAVNLSDNGTLSYAYFTIGDLRDHHSNYGTNAFNANNNLRVISNVTLTDDGQLTYTYVPILNINYQIDNSTNAYNNQIIKHTYVMTSNKTIYIHKTYDNIWGTIE